MRLSFLQEVLLAAAAGLSLILLVEAWFFIPEPALTGPIAAETEAPDTAPSTEEVLSFSLAPRESMRDFVERPLFEKTRRSTVETYMPKDNVTLVGIVLNADERIAILRAQSGANPVRAHIGDAVGDWRVMDITQNSVLLRNNESVQ